MKPRVQALHRMTAAFVIAVGAAGLAGCTGSAVAIEPMAARQLQSSVVAVAHSVAAGNTQQALARLDKLSIVVQADTASGAITSERAAAIRAAIAKVRADLTAAKHSAPPATQPSKDSSGSSSDSGSSSTPSSTPVPTTGGAGGSGESGGSGTSGGSTPPPATSTSSPSDSPTSTPSAPPPTTVSTSGP